MGSGFDDKKRSWCFFGRELCFGEFGSEGWGEGQVKAGEG